MNWDMSSKKKKDGSEKDSSLILNGTTVQTPIQTIYNPQRNSAKCTTKDSKFYEHLVWPC